jgi:hypothetical protein
MDFHRPANHFWLALCLLAATMLACQTLAPGVEGRRPTPTPPEAIATLDLDDLLDGADDDGAAPDFDYDLGSAPGYLTLDQGAAGVAFDESRLPFLSLFPALRDAPAPAWLGPGARVTYRVQSASIAQAAGEEGSAGAGYVQNDVVAVEGGLIVATSKLYLDRLDGDGVLPYGLFPSLGLPGVGDYWLNPAPLAEAEQLAVPDLAVTRHSETFAGERFDTLRFDYTPEDAHYVWKFDPESGLLLEYRHDLGGDDAAHRQITIVTFVGSRQLDRPWAGARRPSWVCRASWLRYSGSFVSVVAGDAGPGLDYAVEIDLRDCAERWAAYDLASRLEDLPAETATRLGGAAQLFDSLWLPAAALDALDSPQVLDRDPITGAEVNAEPNPDGTLTLWETGDYYSAALTYDEDGRLVALEQQQQIGLAETIITLTLEDWE